MTPLLGQCPYDQRWTYAMPFIATFLPIYLPNKTKLQMQLNSQKGPVDLQSNSTTWVIDSWVIFLQRGLRCDSWWRRLTKWATLERGGRLRNALFVYSFLLWRTLEVPLLYFHWATWPSRFANSPSSPLFGDEGYSVLASCLLSSSGKFRNATNSLPKTRPQKCKE